MKVVCISDTHTDHRQMFHEIPSGDVLLHAGDIMSYGWEEEEITDFLDWFEALPHQHKIFIAGNHDRYFEKYPEDIEEMMKDYPSITYLKDSYTIVEGYKIYGSPYQPWFYDWAFNVERGEEIAKVWAKIPDDVDILITHGPVHGVLDKVLRGELVGCEDLLNRVKEINPKLHLCGHIHEAYGKREIDGTVFVNASICTLSYIPSNKPIVVEI